MRYTSHYISPFGGITLAADGRGITGLWFDGQKYFGDTLDKENERRELPVLEEAEKWLDVYFPGKSGTYPAAAFRGYIFPSSGLGHSFADSLRNNDHLWKNRTSDCGKKRGRPGLCPGGGRSCRAQSHFYLLSLPPCCRKQWKPDRIFGRFAEKSSAAYAGTCKYGAFLSAEKGTAL